MAWSSSLLSWVWNFYLKHISRRLHFPHTFPPVGPSGQQHGLSSLPVEILSQILVRLGYSNLLAVRLTCKTFYSVTKTRQFWQDRITELREIHGVSPPEAGPDKYTVEELEKWVLRRGRIQDVLANSIQPRFRTRNVGSCPTGLRRMTPDWRELLPGGRWLLTVHPSAVVHVLDLDSTNPTPRLLFDPSEFDPEVTGKRVIISYGIWIDRRAPRLSFRIAGFVWDKEKSRTYVYQVDLVGHGADATLVASKVSIFRCFKPDKISEAIALNDRYFVQIWEGSDPNHKEIEVYNYHQALGRLEYSLIESGIHPFKLSHFSGIEFIDQNVFAIDPFGAGSLHIFEVESPTSIKLLHSVPLKLVQRSETRWTPGASRIVIGDRIPRGRRSAIVIPHDKRLPPMTVDLGAHNPEEGWKDFTLGISASLSFRLADKSIRIASHGWDLTSTSPTVQKHLPTFNHVEDLTFAFVAFDEDTGRMIFARNLSHTLLIVDII